MFTLPLAFAVFGTTELMLIGGIIVILFGASKLPELARSVGKAQTEYEVAKAESQVEIAAAKRRAKEEIQKGDGEDKLPKLQAAAEALGIETEGKSAAELREAIARETSES